VRPRPVLAVVAVTLAVACGGCTTPVAGSVSAADPLAWTAFPAPPTTRLGARPLQAVLDALVATGRTYPMATTGTPGVTAAVITAAGTWTGAAGADGRGAPLQASSRLGIGDLTMTVTAAELLRLAEERRLDLDARVSALVPGGPDAPVRSVLAMRSGQPDLSDVEYTALAAAVAADPGRRWTVLDAQALAPAGPQTAVPAYDALGYAWLGLLVERVTGLPYDRAVERDLLASVSLTDPSMDGPAVAPGPDGRGPDGRSTPPALAATVGATGLITDAGSLARWGWELYGARILRPASVAAMTTPAGPGWVANRPYGLGTMIFSATIAPQESFGHVGRVPGYSALLVVAPWAQISVAVLAIGGGKELADAGRALFLAAGLPG
jgi:D-alanyl-D-alanine carboxypeptidase